MSLHYMDDLEYKNNFYASEDDSWQKQNWYFLLMCYIF